MYSYDNNICHFRLLLCIYIVLEMIATPTRLLGNGTYSDDSRRINTQLL